MGLLRQVAQAAPHGTGSAAGRRAAMQRRRRPAEGDAGARQKATQASPPMLSDRYEKKDQSIHHGYHSGG